MTSPLTTISLFIVTLTFGQSIQIDTLRIKRSEQFKGVKYANMHFPIIRSGDKQIDSLINSDLMNRFIGNEYLTDNLDSAFMLWLGDQIIFLDFQVTCNRNGILSINISAEGCGAYCTHWTHYFNYSTLNGEWLDISDVIANVAEFKKRLNSDRNKQYEKQKQLLKEIFKDQASGLEESTYKWAVMYYENCQKKSRSELFAIYNDHLEIIENCYLPNAIKNLTPTFELKYYFVELKENLKIESLK